MNAVTAKRPFELRDDGHVMLKGHFKTQNLITSIADKRFVYLIMSFKTEC